MKKRGGREEKQVGENKEKKKKGRLSEERKERIHKTEEKKQCWNIPSTLSSSSATASSRFQRPDKKGGNKVWKIIQEPDQARRIQRENVHPVEKNNKKNITISCTFLQHHPQELEVAEPGTGNKKRDEEKVNEARNQ